MFRNPVEHFAGTYAYTLPSLMLGFAIVYFTYVKPAKLRQKHVLVGLLITWAISSFLVFLFGTEFFDSIVYLITPIIIGYIVFYLLRKKVNEQSDSTTQDL